MALLKVVSAASTHRGHSSRSLWNLCITDRALWDLCIAARAFLHTQADVLHSRWT